MFCRDRELIAMKKLASNGLAAPLYARFANGIVCGYIKGTTISADQFKNLEMQRQVLLEKVRICTCG